MPTRAAWTVWPDVDETKWTRARCDTSACVEVRASLVFEDTVVLRSSVNPQSVLPVKRDEWAAFVAGVKAGDFDNI